MKNVATKNQSAKAAEPTADGGLTSVKRAISAQPLNCVALESSSSSTRGDAMKVAKRSISHAFLAAAGLACAAQLFVACQPNSGGSTSGAGSNPSGSQPTTLGGNATGTGDSTGGNGLNGKVFESYSKDVTKLPAWNKHIAHIEANFAAVTKDRSDGFDFTEVLSRTARSRRWYIAPITLTEIKKSKLGVDFFADPVDQLALQTREGEIWIDASKFGSVDNPSHNDMNAQADLIAHEVAMSLYLFRFMKLSEILLMLEPNQNPTAAERKEMDEAFPPESARELNKEDYSRIRTMTTWLVHKGASAKSRNEINKAFYANRFDPRLFRNYDSSNSETAKKNVTKLDLAQALVNAPSLGRMANICDHGALAKPKSGLSNANCEIKATLTQGTDADLLVVQFVLTQNGATKTYLLEDLVYNTGANSVPTLWDQNFEMTGVRTRLQWYGGLAVPADASGKKVALKHDDVVYEVGFLWSEDLQTVEGVVMNQRIAKSVAPSKSVQYGGFSYEAVWINMLVPADGVRADIVATLKPARVSFYPKKESNQTFTIMTNAEPVEAIP